MTRNGKMPPVFIGLPRCRSPKPLTATLPEVQGPTSAALPSTFDVQRSIRMSETLAQTQPIEAYPRLSKPIRGKKGGLPNVPAQLDQF